MMRHNSLLIFLLILTVVGQSFAQENILKDSSFFHRTALIDYQEWLDSSGLGKLLKVETITVDSNSLSLYLGFHTENTDTIINTWEKLKISYDDYYPDSLEEGLFYKMPHLMEIPDSQCIIQIYDTYDLSVQPCFFKVIYFEDGELRTESSGCRDPIDREMELNIGELTNGKKVSEQEIAKALNRDMVYQKIIDHAKEYYKSINTDNIPAEVNVLEKRKKLRFEVINLRREVLTDEANPLLAEILTRWGYRLNWVKREMLNFTIIYTKTEHGIKLHLSLDGKYGSGLFRQIERGGYLPMDPKFKKYLEVYADRFSESIRDIF